MILRRTYAKKIRIYNNIRTNAHKLKCDSVFSVLPDIRKWSDLPPTSTGTVATTTTTTVQNMNYGVLQFEQEYCVNRDWSLTFLIAQEVCKKWWWHCCFLYCNMNSFVALNIDREKFSRLQIHVFFLLFCRHVVYLFWHVFDPSNVYHFFQIQNNNNNENEAINIRIFNIYTHS